MGVRVSVAAKATWHEKQFRKALAAEEARKADAARRADEKRIFDDQMKALNDASEQAAQDARTMQLRVDSIQSQLEDFIKEARAMALQTSQNAKQALDIAKSNAESVAALTATCTQLFEQLNSLAARAAVKDAEVHILAERVPEPPQKKHEAGSASGPAAPL